MINHRYRLLAALAALSFAGLVVVSAPAVAQPREGHFRIGVLVSSVFRGPHWGAFADELRKLGYVEGQNTTLEVRGAESQFERLPALAAELVALNPDVIFTSAQQPIMALKKLEEISIFVRQAWDIGCIAMIHRLGHLNIGETSVAVVVTSAHRRASFDACHYAIDKLKKVVPIWKKEFFEDGEVWIEGQ
jgi:hypothetical protein